MTALTALSALALAACGGGGAAKDPKDPTPGRDLPLKGEKIEVAAVWTGPEQENFTKVLREFEKRTGATVTFVPAQDPIVNFLGTKIAGGSPPDVAMLPQVGAIQQAAAQKWLKPVGPEAKAQLAANYSPGWQKLGAVDGTQYGVYFKAANKSLVWYNTAVFENAGATEPKTWKEFLTTAETISAPASPRSRSAARTAGPSRTGSRTSTSPRRGRPSTTSWRSTRSSGPTRPSPRR